MKEKIKGIGEAEVKSWKKSGVTVEEFVSFYGAGNKTIVNYIAREYEQKLEDNWIVFTISEMK